MWLREGMLFKSAVPLLSLPRGQGEGSSRLATSETLTLILSPGEEIALHRQGHDGFLHVQAVFGFVVDDAVAGRR